MAQNSPHIFGAAFICTSTAPEPHQVQIEKFMNEAVPSCGLKFLEWSKVTRFPQHTAEASHCNSSENDVNVYGRVQLLWQLLLIWLSLQIGPRKRNAASNDLFADSLWTQFLLLGTDYFSAD